MRNGTVGFVYFVHAPDHRLVKIGVTTGHPESRFSALATLSPAPLVRLGVLPADPWTEAEIHQQFRDDRAHGEWFRETDDLWAFIREFSAPWPEECRVTMKVGRPPAKDEDYGVWHRRWRHEREFKRFNMRNLIGLA